MELNIFELGSRQKRQTVVRSAKILLFCPFAVRTCRADELRSFVPVTDPRIPATASYRSLLVSLGLSRPPNPGSRKLPDLEQT